MGKSRLIFKRWTWVSLLFLFVVIGLGLFLRYFYIHPVPGLNYKYWLHGHSHVAFLGWVFNALFVALVSAYIQKAYLHVFDRLFWFLQLTVLGMLILFPWQGYAAGSIIVSTLHIFLSYIFVWLFVKHRKEETFSESRFHFSFTIARFALILMVISSIGPFALGAIMANNLAKTHWYQLAIYFYLHFQYNGWFLFAVMALFFKWLEDKSCNYTKQDGKVFFLLNALSVIPAYAASALWIQPPIWINGLAGLAAFIQLVSIYFIYNIFKSLKQRHEIHTNKMVVMLWVLVFISFVTKNILQVIESIPFIAALAYRFRNIIIAYLHLNFIGITSFFLLGWFIQMGWLNLSLLIQKGGLWLFVGGFIITELILVVHSFFNMSGLPGLSNLFDILFFLNLLLLAGLSLIFFTQKLA